MEPCWRGAFLFVVFLCVLPSFSAWLVEAQILACEVAGSRAIGPKICLFFLFDQSSGARDTIEQLLNVYIHVKSKWQ